MFREWRHALRGSLGLLAACGGEATSAEDASSSGGTTSRQRTTAGRTSSATTDGTTAAGATGTGGASGSTASIATTDGNATTAGNATTDGNATTGSGGTPNPNVVHRPTPEVCEPFEPSSESAIPEEYLAAGGQGGAGLPIPDFACEFDAECNVGVNGDCYFYHSDGDGEFVGTRCDYGCNEDADCPAGRVCDCNGGNNRCINARCTTDSDCPTGELCIKTEYYDGCDSYPWFACQTPLDECVADSDCMESGCGFDPDSGRHQCMEPSCAIGRPFLVHGVERRATLAARRDWQTPTNVDVSRLSHAQRRELAGPGLLAMDGALAESDLASIVVNAVIEGCIGETVAAAEARLGADVSEDPAVKAALGGIATDESRHAELAFAFARWAILQSPELAPLVLEVVRDELSRTRATTPSRDDAWLTSHGLLPELQRAALRRSALEHMVLPCLRAICSVGSGPGLDLQLS